MHASLLPSLLALTPSPALHYTTLLLLLLPPGQRGLNRNFGFRWPRDCPHTDYCWEAVTGDVSKMQTFFDFAWDPYYIQYYVQACGGEWGTHTHEDPYQFYTVNGRRTSRGALPGGVYRLNVTTPATITGRGGTALMDISYVCRGDFCSAAAGRFGRGAGGALALAAALTIATLLSAAL
jgi:hypothetical protein